MTALVSCIRGAGRLSRVRLGPCLLRPALVSMCCRRAVGGMLRSGMLATTGVTSRHQPRGGSFKDGECFELLMGVTVNRCGRLASHACNILPSESPFYQGDPTFALQRQLADERCQMTTSPAHRQPFRMRSGP